MSDAFSGRNFGRTSRNRKQFAQPGSDGKDRVSDAPGHGNNASALSWIGGGVLVIGIILGAATQSAVAFWVLAGLAVQLWIVSAIIRPIEAIWALLNERLPKKDG